MLIPSSLPVLQQHSAVLPNVASNDDTSYTICLWDLGGGVPCNERVRTLDLSKHLRTHGVEGSARRVMVCEWGGCERAPMKRESIVRHIEEVHLHMRYLCGQCSASFSRRATRNTHLSNYHAHT